MHENKNLKFIHQQKIKNRLCNIELQEAQTAHYHYQHYYLHKQLHKKQSDYHDVSDWTNHFDIPEQPNNQPTQDKQHNDTKRFTFFSAKRYHSSLLSPKNNKSNRLQLSPIVVKFNAKVLSQNLQRSREKMMRKLKEDPYMSHYESLYLLHEQRNKKQTPPKCVQLQLGKLKADIAREMHPRTQRLSSIFRLMKRQQTLRVNGKKPANPENLVTTQLKF